MTKGGVIRCGTGTSFAIKLTLPDCSSGKVPDRTAVRFGARFLAVMLSKACRGHKVVTQVFCYSGCRHVCSKGMPTHLAIRQNAAGELVVLVAICSLDNCFKAVTFLSTGGCELLQCPPSKANTQSYKTELRNITGTTQQDMRQVDIRLQHVLTTPSAVVLDRFNTLLNWKTPLLFAPYRSSATGNVASICCCDHQ